MVTFRRLMTFAEGMRRSQGTEGMRCKAWSKLRVAVEDLSPRFKFWLCCALIAGSLLVLATYFAAILYLSHENSLFSADAELCMWHSLAQDVIRTFPHCGLIRLNDSRGVVELAFNVLAVLVGGVSVWKAMWIYAFFSALASTGIAALLALRQENGRVVFAPAPFVTAVLLQASFYYLNVGHEASYALAVLCMWSFVWEFRRKWLQHCLLFALCMLGVANDDMFCVIFVCPVIALFMLRTMVGGAMDWRLPSIVLGCVLGFALLKCLLMFGVSWWPRTALSLSRVEDLGQWFADMVGAYANMFRMNSYMGATLTPERWFRFAARFGVLVLCLWFFATEVTRCVRQRFPKGSEVSCCAILAIVLLCVSYCFVAVRTKRLHAPVPRYVYFGSLSFIALLVKGSFQPHVTKLFKRGVLLLAVMAALVSAYEDVVSRFSNRGSRKCLNAVVKELSAAGVGHVYSDYWTAFSLAAAGRGKVSSVAIVYDRKKDAFVHRNVSFLDATYDEECHAYVRPTRKASSKLATPEENQRAAVKAFGKPSRCVTIGSDYEIMFYEKNIALGAPPLPEKK